MASTITTAPPRLSGSGSGAGRGGERRDGGDGPGGRKPGETHLLGMALGLTSVAMLFIALTSAYIVREGAGNDWRRLHMPPLLWFNTASLLASSWTLEKARLSYGRQSLGTRRWLTATLLLGLVFLAGQLCAWRVLSAQGIYLSANPHSSFFYVLSGTHALHLLGGIVALMWLTWRSVPSRDREGAVVKTGWIEATSLYWHFMDGLWIYLLALLFFWS